MLVGNASDTKVRNRRAREQALVSAAGRLFARRGYEATTTREIAAAARCAEGLISRYFNGKAGLLLALIRSRVASDVTDLSDKIPIAKDFDKEITQLIAWEVDHMWEEREFLGVVVPRALVEPQLGRMVSKLGPARRGDAIAKRLERFHECRHLPPEELKALADSVGAIGFMFGFMRPVVLGQDRARAKKVATTIAKLLARGIQCFPSASRNRSHSRPKQV
ncbi:MAG TPA: helix-turn-helix domain-containing protein [Terriglobales bacterium]|nr:helix-turn-helix domain-containing protein [Terriglobales bacterium]